MMGETLTAGVGRANEGIGSTKGEGRMTSSPAEGTPESLP